MIPRGELRGTGGAAVMGLVVALGAGYAGDSRFAPPVAPPPGVSVTPDGGTEPARAENSSGHVATFNVAYTGSGPETFEILCYSTGPVTCMSTSANGFLTLDAGENENVQATYNVGLAGTGTLTLEALGPNDLQDTGSFSVPVVRYAVAVTPDGGQAPERVRYSTGFSESFTVTNTGTTTQTFAFACSATNLTCGTVTPGSAPLAPSAYTSVTVAYSTVGSAMSTLRLTASNANSADTGSYLVPVVKPLQVTPHTAPSMPGGGSTFAPVNSTGNVATYTVTNVRTQAESYTLTCQAGSGITCGTVTPSSLALDPGAAAQVQVTYNATAVSNPTLRLLAQAQAYGGADTGTYTVAVFTQAPEVTVTPDGGSASAVSPSVGNVAAFTVSNVSGTNPQTFTLQAGCTAPVINCVADSMSVQLALGAQKVVNVRFDVEHGTGTGKVLLEAVIPDAAEIGSVNVSTAGAAFVLSTGMNFKDRHDKTGCAVGGAGPGAAFYCGELLVMQPIVGYRSMNEMRTPTLVYSSRAATGSGEVLVDVTLQGGGAAVPSTVIAHLYLGGALRNTVHYAVKEWGGTQWGGGAARRLSLPVPPGLASGVHDGFVELRRIFPTITKVDTALVSVVIVKRDDSPFGAGWWFGGVGRAYTNGAQTAVTIVEAEGSAVVFRKSGSVWVAPVGVKDTLTTEYWCPAGFPCRWVYKRTLKHRVVLRYDLANGRLVADSEPTGTWARFVWTANAIDGVRLDTIVDEAGKRVRFSYNGSGRLTTVRVPGAPATNIYIGAAGTIDSVADPDGIKTKFTYDVRRRATQRTGRRTGEVTSFRYAPSDSTIALLDSIGTPDGWLVHQAYQRAGIPAPGKGTASVPATPGLPGNAVVIVRDIRMVATRINVDRLGRPLRIAAQDSGTVTITRDTTTSLPTQVLWWPLGRRMNFYWNTALDLDSTVEHSPIEWAGQTAKTGYQYHPTFHSITQVTSPLGFVTQYQYSGTTGVLERIITPGPDTTRFDYNTQGQVLRVWEPGKAYPTEYGYVSGTGNLSWVMTPRGHVTAGADGKDSTRFVYDTSGTLITQVFTPKQGGTQVQTVYTYDAVHRVRRVDTGSNRKDSTHFANGERTIQRIVPSATGWLNRVHTDSVDALGRLIKQCSPAMANGCSTYLYGYDGLLDQVTVAGGLTVRRVSYDSLARVTEFNFTAPTGQTQWSGKAAYTDTLRYTYNQVGAIVRADNRRGIVGRGYYESGRLACEYQLIKKWSNFDTTGANTFAVEYYYDRDGRLTRKKYGHSLGFFPQFVGPSACSTVGSDTAVVRYTYDARGRVDSIIGANFKINDTLRFRFFFDAVSRRDSVRNNKTAWIERFRYNEDNQLLAHAWHSPSYPYGYVLNDSFPLRDDAGRVLTRYGQDCGPCSYTYDNLGQLLTAPSETFTYDSYGAAELQTAWHGPAQDTHTRDSYGRITQSLIGSVGSQPVAHHYAYNAAGDRLRDSIPTGQSTWARTTRTNIDGAGRVVAMKLFPGTGVSNDSMHLWTYWYDPLGRRILAADSVPTLAQPVKRFFYDGDNVVLVGDGYFQAQGGVDAIPVRLHNPGTNSILNDLGIDRPLASVGYGGYDTGCGGSPVEGSAYFYHADERGSIRNVTYSSSGVCVGTGYSYQGFGASGGAIPTNSQPGFTGAQSDASGLVFMRNRFYDPNTATFTQPDPIGVLGGINLFGYVGNDPVQYTDPFGDTLRLVGSEAFLNDVARVRENADADGAFRVLEQSSTVFAIIETGAITLGMMSGQSFDRDDAHDYHRPLPEAQALAPNARGIAVVDPAATQRNGQTVGMVALHEAIHLGGIAKGKGGHMVSHKNCQAYQPEIRAGAALGRAIEKQVAENCKQ